MIKEVCNLIDQNQLKINKLDFCVQNKENKKNDFSQHKKEMFP